MSTSQDSDALMADIFDLRPHRMECWRQVIPDEAKAFLTNVEARMANGERAVATKLAKVLTEHFGHRISSQQVSRHYRGACSCPR